MQPSHQLTRKHFWLCQILSYAPIAFFLWTSIVLILTWLNDAELLKDLHETAALIKRDLSGASRSQILGAALLDIIPSALLGVASVYWYKAFQTIVRMGLYQMNVVKCLRCGIAWGASFCLSVPFPVAYAQHYILTYHLEASQRAFSTGFGTDELIGFFVLLLILFSPMLVATYALERAVALAQENDGFI